MARLVVNQGLKMIGDRASGVTGAAAAINGMSVDDGTVAFAATHTALNTGGAPTNVQGNALDSLPTGGAAANPYVVTHLMTLTASQFNTFTVKRVALHNTSAPTVSSATLIAGEDGLSLVKQSTFSIQFTMKMNYPTP